MRKIDLGVFLKETSVTVKCFLRQRSTLVWMIMIPVIISLICSSFILVFDDQRVGCVYVQDNDDTNISHKTVDAINEQIKVVQVDKGLSLDEIKALKDNDSRTVVGIIILPDGYSKWAINAGLRNEGKAMVYLDEKSYEIDLKVTGTPTSDREPSIIVTADIGGSTSSVIEDIFGSDYSLFIQLTPGIVIAVLAEIVLGLTLGARSSLRESGVSKMIRNTNLRKYHVLFANMVCSLLPSAIVCALTFCVIDLFYPIPVSGMTVLFLFLSSLCLVSMGLLLSVFIRNRQSSSIAVCAILVPMLFFSGALIPYSAMFEWMKVFYVISPMSYMITGLKQSLGMVGGTDTWICIAVILLSTVIFSIAWMVLESRRTE